MQKIEIKDDKYLMGLVEKIDPTFENIPATALAKRCIWESLMFFDGASKKTVTEYLDKYEHLF